MRTKKNEGAGAGSGSETGTQTDLGGATGGAMGSISPPRPPQRGEGGNGDSPPAPAAAAPAATRGRKKGSKQKPAIGIVAQKTMELRDAKLMAKVLADYTKMTAWGRGYFMTEAKKLELQPEIPGLNIPSKALPQREGETVLLTANGRQ